MIPETKRETKTGTKSTAFARKHQPSPSCAMTTPASAGPTSRQLLKRIEFSRLVRPFKTRMHGVMTLLAGLELTRRRRVKLRQVEMFSELWMYAGAEAGEEPEPAEETADRVEAPVGPKADGVGGS